MTNNEILDFIKKFKFKYSDELEYVFLNGNCYYFAMILANTFNGIICYIPVDCHFTCKIDNRYYDITGEIKPDSTIVSWDEYKMIDTSHAKRITDDCINFKTRI